VVVETPTDKPFIIRHTAEFPYNSEVFSITMYLHSDDVGDERLMGYNYINATQQLIEGRRIHDGQPTQAEARRSERAARDEAARVLESGSGFNWGAGGL
jgi:hypothetical protein